jgi:hypothetical protein
MHLHEYLTHDVWGANIHFSNAGLHLHDYAARGRWRLTGRRSEALGDFLLRGALGGALGGFIWTMIAMGAGGRNADFRLFMIFLSPSMMLVSSLPGAFVGGVVWLTRRYIKVSSKTWLALWLAVLAFVAVIKIIYEPRVNHDMLLLVVWVMLVQRLASLLANANFSPLHAVLFGSRLPDNETLTLVSLGRWSLTGAPLRSASIIVLLASLLAFEFYALEGQQKGLATLAYFIFYCAVSVVLSFARIRFLVAFFQGLLINLPVVILACHFPAQPSFFHFASTMVILFLDHADRSLQLIQLALLLLLPLWVLFIFGGIAQLKKSDEPPADAIQFRHRGRILFLD